MKKNSKIFIFLVILVVIIIFIGLKIFVFTHHKINPSTEPNTIPEVLVKNFFDKKDDGWVYNFRINIDKDTNKNSYFFNGYNMKYEEMEGFYVPMVDESGNVIEKLSPGYVTLVNSEEYKEEIKLINNYFTDKQFNKVITFDDLKDLTIEKLDKNYILSLFNRAIELKAEKVDGKYANAPVFGLKTKDSIYNEVDGKWLVSYLLKNGNLYSINIEFISKNGNYLFNENNNLDSIESAIVKKQKIAVASAKINNQDLINLLNELETELESY